MKMRVKLIFLMTGMLLICLAYGVFAGNEITGKVITGDTITGQASAQQFDVSLLIDNGPPKIFIASPADRSNYSYPFNCYNVNNISLNISAYDIDTLIDSIWYNLNGGANASFIGNTTIYASDGAHLLTAYANDSAGNINSTNRSFIVNSSLGWFLCTTKYNGTTSNLTDLIIQGKIAEQSISNFTLERTAYGKVVFNENINISRDLCYLPAMTSVIDEHSDVFSSTMPLLAYAYSDAAYLHELNKSATIWLYNLNYSNGSNAFSNPAILRNGAACASSACVIESYINGTLKFNVTNFDATFSVSEAQQEEEVTIISGGGGGGGVSYIEKPKKIKVEPSSLGINLMQGDRISKKITITNIWTGKINIVLFADAFERFMKISPRNFELNSGESKDVEIEFFANENTETGLYIGKIYAKADDTQEEVFTAINVEQRILFSPEEFNLDIELKEKQVMPGGDVVFDVSLITPKGLGEINVSVQYILKDSEDRIIERYQERASVYGEKKFEKRIKLSENISYGEYVLFASMDYKEEQASDLEIFEVVPKISGLIYLLIAAAILLAGAIIWIVIKMIILSKKGKIYIQLAKDSNGNNLTFISSSDEAYLKKIARKFSGRLRKVMSYDILESRFELFGDYKARIKNELIGLNINKRQIVEK